MLSCAETPSSIRSSVSATRRSLSSLFCEDRSLSSPTPPTLRLQLGVLEGPPEQRVGWLDLGGASAQLAAELSVTPQRGGLDASSVEKARGATRTRHVRQCAGPETKPALDSRVSNV